MFKFLLHTYNMPVLTTDVQQLPTSDHSYCTAVAEMYTKQ